LLFIEMRSLHHAPSAFKRGRLPRESRDNGIRSESRFSARQRHDLVGAHSVAGIAEQSGETARNLLSKLDLNNPSIRGALEIDLASRNDAEETTDALWGS